MTVSGIRSNVSINAARNVTRERSELSSIISSVDVSRPNYADTPAAIVEISKPAMLMAMNSRKARSTEDFYSPQDLPGDLFSPEKLQKAQAESPESVNRPDDPFAYEDQALSIEREFTPGSPQDVMSSVLEGKAINSSVVANELSSMICQTITGSSASVEQRAENRESALKCAHYIADKYLDPSEKVKFMSAVEKLYFEDIRTDKGTGPEPGKRAGNGGIGGKMASPDGFDKVYSRALGVNSVWRNFKSGSGEHTDFVHAFFDFLTDGSGEEKAAAESKSIAIDRESTVERAVMNAKTNFNHALFDNNISRLLKTFSQ